METYWVEPGVFCRARCWCPCAACESDGCGAVVATQGGCVSGCVYFCKAEKDQEGKCNTKLGP